MLLKVRILKLSFEAQNFFGSLVRLYGFQILAKVLMLYTSIVISDLKSLPVFQLDLN